MILSRLTRAVKGQNWFAVVLEFVIVVSGVLLAFQVSAWSSEASDRAYARDILVRLHRELISVGRAREQGEQLRAERLRLLLEVRPIIMGRVEADALSREQCAAVAFAHSGVGGAPDDFPSLDELMSSGALENIRSDNLRQVAMELASKRSAVRVSAGRSAMRVVDLAVAYPEAVRATLVADPDETGDGWDRSASCDLTAMRTDPSFQAAFLTNADAYRTHVEFVYRFLDDAISTLQDALEAELNLEAGRSNPEPAP